MRETGYYWIEFSIERIGFYDSKVNKWLLMGMDIEISDENVTVLNENMINYENN